MIVYLDPSAWVKNYLLEPGSDLVRSMAATATALFMSRVGFIEMSAALGQRGDASLLGRFRSEWLELHVVEIDAPLVERAAELALESALRSLDALHLASALLLPRGEVAMATWDRRLHTAAAAQGLPLLPESL